MQQNISTNLDLALEYLKSGKLVSFPTETVYGLGADARNPNAIQKVFQVKGRPATHPLIVHLAAATQLAEWTQDIPATAWQLAKHFWPGPLTLILPKHPQASNLITGGQDTIAVRVPKHPLTLELLKQFGGGLVGPSANKYGRVSPTLAAHVAADLGVEVALILDGGACTVGIESTIVNLCSATPMIMRAGQISAAQIEEVLNEKVIVHPATAATIRVPGSDKSHYAPHTPLQVLTYADLLQTVQELQRQAKTLSVISFQQKPINLSTHLYWQQVQFDPDDFAHNLYANLRAHDQLNNSVILLEQPPLTNPWTAIQDRLARADSKT